jgi:nucleotide-binding universal stress UspA family protein
MIKPLFQKVLIAYDGSVSSLHAVQYGIMMAKIYKCQLKAVYVVDDASIKKLVLSKFLVSDEGNNMREHLLSDGKRNVEYIKELARKKNVKLETEILSGSVWAEVVRAAGEYKANLILLGDSTDTSSTDYHSKMKKGAIEIVGNAGCSVLVVKEPYVEQLFKLC